MSENPLIDPTNRIVSVFDTPEDALCAKKALLEAGLAEGQIKVIHGGQAASEVDTAPKWFADTDVELKRFKSALKDNKAVVSVPVEDKQQREAATQVLAQTGAALTTHFGRWVTKTEKLNG